MATLKKAIVLLLLLTTVKSHASHFPSSYGSRAAALGNQGICLANIWATRNNPAALSLLKHPTASLFYENKYGVTELSTQSIAIGYPTQYGTIAATGSFFGDNIYKETFIGLSYGKLLSKKFSLGIQLDYFSIKTSAEEFNKTNAISFDIGILYQLSDKLIIGSHIYNPLNVKISENANERIPTAITIGSMLTISNNLLMFTQIEKVSNRQEDYSIALEYKLKDFLFARGGVSTSPEILSFGFGVNINSFTFDISSTMHQTLGFSPQATLSYSF
ncbi:MAG: hypothetical protein U9R32_06210 [Bacteroidota bacterium]|nr:hypothetical protein [Bacteroidota bacterium]